MEIKLGIRFYVNTITLKTTNLKTLQQIKVENMKVVHDLKQMKEDNLK